MKYLFVVALFFGSIGQAMPGVRIRSASNVQDKSAIFEVWGTKPNLVELNLETGLAQTVPWPSDVVSEEIMGMLLLKDSLYLVAQWTIGDGKNPHLYRYDRSAKKWKKSGEVGCVSFDKIELNKASLTVKCEEDPRDSTPAKDVKVLLLTTSQEKLSLVFPLSRHKTKSASYKLEGEILNWNKVIYGRGDSLSKTIGAAELEKAR